MVPRGGTRFRTGRSGAPAPEYAAARSASGRVAVASACGRATARGLATGLALVASTMLAAPAAGQVPDGYRGGQVVTSTGGMVVSAAPLASAVGAEILAAGGTAVDAAVAAAFALAVVEPSMSGLGGRTNLVLRTSSGELAGLDGFTEVPAGYERRPGDDARGYGTIGIPGTVAALTVALERYGTLPRAAVMAPAIRLAAGGYALPPLAAERIAARAEVFRSNEGTRRVFLKPDGSTYVAGEWFRQPELASTLRRIAEGGAAEFYRGEIARRIAADMAAHDAHLTYDDLAGYRAEPALLVRGTYRGHDLVGTFLPASGVTTIEALQIMEATGSDAPAGSAEWAAVAAAALRLAYEDRDADHGPAEEKARRLTSPEWARERARLVRVPAGVGGAASGRGHTTHLSVVDGEGAVVAMTQSLGDAFGSHVVTPGLGFVYASTLQYTDVLPGTPRPRPGTSQSPLIVFRDGAPVYVVGAAGGRRIVTSLVTVLSRMIDGGASLPAAMAAPRLHPLMVTNELQLEGEDGRAWSEEAVASLEALGLNPVEGDSFGRIHAIAIDPATGVLTGVADPRGRGGAASP